MVSFGNLGIPRGIVAFWRESQMKHNYAYHVLPTLQSGFVRCLCSASPLLHHPPQQMQTSNVNFKCKLQRHTSCPSTSNADLNFRSPSCHICSPWVPKWPVHFKCRSQVQTSLLRQPKTQSPKMAVLFKCRSQVQTFLL